MNFTLFESHWHDTASGPGTRSDADEAPEGSQTSTEASRPARADGGRGRLLTRLTPYLLVAGAAAGALAARRFRARRSARAAELRQVEVDAVEYANGIDD